MTSVHDYSEQKILARGCFDPRYIEDNFYEASVPQLLFLLLLCDFFAFVGLSSVFCYFLGKGGSFVFSVFVGS